MNKPEVRVERHGDLSKLAFRVMSMCKLEYVDKKRKATSAAASALELEQTLLRCCGPVADSTRFGETPSVTRRMHSI